MWFAVAIVVFLTLAVVIMYNGLVSRKNRVENAFASTDVMLKKRYDLIQNLVATVKGYAKHEQNILHEITQLRARAAAGNVPTDEAVARNNQISRALLGVFAVVENYPEFKANHSFLQLQRALNEIEEQISASRRAYNAAVTDMNDAVEMFPTNLIARMTGYRTLLKALGKKDSEMASWQQEWEKWVLQLRYP